MLISSHAKRYFISISSQKVGVQYFSLSHNYASLLFKVSNRATMHNQYINT